MKVEVGVNSYFSVEDANTLITENYYSRSDELTVWESLSEQDKENFVVKCARTIDKQMLLGIKCDREQPLQFPRYKNGLKHELPEILKFGIIDNELNIIFNANSEEGKLKSKGIKNYSVEGASISFVDTAEIKLIGGIIDTLRRTYFNEWVY